MSIGYQTDFDWTEARVAELRTLFDQQYAASHMAGVFGITRSAVLGKLHRLGLKRGYSRKDAGVEGRRAQKRARGEKRKVRRMTNHGSRFDVVEVYAPRPMPEPAAPIVCNPVPLLELPFTGACKFEVSGSEKAAEYLFCSNATDRDCVYCPAHMDVAHSVTRGPRPHLVYALRRRHLDPKTSGVEKIDVRELE